MLLCSLTGQGREQREVPGLTSWPLWQPRALLWHTLPFRKENPRNRYETSGSAIKGRLIAPLPFTLFEKAFHKVPEPRTNNSEIGEERERGEKVEKECNSGLWKTRKAFHKVPEPRTNNSEIGEEREGRESRKGV